MTKTSNAHERDAVWSPDGKWIAYNSDESGENELYVRAQDGKGQAQQLTKAADTYYYQPIWSPDSKKLLWSDRLQRLRYLDVASKAVTEVAQDKVGEIESYDWSPDSQWIAWGQPELNDQPRVYLYSVASKKSVPVTDEWYGSGRVSFSDDGKYLMLSSARDFKPTFSEEEFREHLSRHAAGLFGDTRQGDRIAARPAERRGWQSRKRRERTRTRPRAKAKRRRARKEEKSKKPVTVKVDTDGIQNRIVGLDITPANYKDLSWWTTASSTSAERSAITVVRTKRRDPPKRSGISASTAWRIARRRSWATSIATRLASMGRRCW